MVHSLSDLQKLGCPAARPILAADGLRSFLFFFLETHCVPVVVCSYVCGVKRASPRSVSEPADKQKPWTSIDSLSWPRLPSSWVLAVSSGAPSCQAQVEALPSRQALANIFRRPHDLAPPRLTHIIPAPWTKGRWSDCEPTHSDCAPARANLYARHFVLSASGLYLVSAPPPGPVDTHG